MTKRAKFDLRAIARIVGSGTASYMVVHVLLLPQLVRFGVGVPAYVYIGVLTTGILSIAVSLLARPRPTKDPVLHPAE